MARHQNFFKISGGSQRATAKSVLSATRRGQGTLEYVLLTALLSGLTFAFVKVIGKDVFGEGLRNLPGKAARCLSHTPDARTNCVND